MFYNFYITPEHKDYLRILWTDTELETIKEYRVKVHLFGATSFPGVAKHGLRKLADDYSQISPEAARYLKEDFYVDDGITSTDIRQQAVELIVGATTICSKGNIRLHMFLSSDKETLRAIPASERGESTKTLYIFNDQLPNERTLGMLWCLESDYSHLTAPEKAAAPPTKRGLMSMAAQIYDPMGLISPCLEQQANFTEEQSWDQMVSLEDQVLWDEWTKEFTKLTRVTNTTMFYDRRHHHNSGATLFR